MREYYLLVDNQQVGPYTAEQLHELLAQGQLTPESPAWYDGLPDWAPLATILEDVPAPIPVRTAPVPVRRAAAAPTTVTLPASPSGIVQTNVKQGALLGGLVCLLLGLGFMYFSLFSFIFYIPLFIVAVILSVVAMAQGRVAGGVLLLLFSLVVPVIAGLVLFAHRASDALASMSPTPIFTTISSQLDTSTSGSPSQADAPTPVTTADTATTTPAADSSAPTNAISDVVPSPPAPPPPPAPKHPALDAKMGFRAYRLGTPLSQFDPNSIEAGEAFVKTDMTPYSVKDFDKTLGAAEIDSIQLDFVQDILQDVIVHVKGKQSSLALKDALIAAYGQPDQTSNMMGESDTWNGDDCVLTFSTEGLTDDDSSADFTSKSVDAKIKAITEQKAQAGAAAGAKNL